MVAKEFQTATLFFHIFKIYFGIRLLIVNCSWCSRFPDRHRNPFLSTPPPKVGTCGYHPGYSPDCKGDDQGQPRKCSLIFFGFVPSCVSWCCREIKWLCFWNRKVVHFSSTNCKQYSTLTRCSWKNIQIENSFWVQWKLSKWWRPSFWHFFVPLKNRYATKAHEAVRCILHITRIIWRISTE